MRNYIIAHLNEKLGMYCPILYYEWYIRKVSVAPFCKEKIWYLCMYRKKFLLSNVEMSTTETQEEEYCQLEPRRSHRLIILYGDSHPVFILLFSIILERGEKNFKKLTTFCLG